DVGAPQLADPILGARRGVDPLAEAVLLVAGQDRRAAGVGPVRQRLQSAPVVGGDPGLDGATADAQGAGDLGCGIALLGQDNGFYAGAGAGGAARPCPPVQGSQGVIVP